MPKALFLSLPLHGHTNPSLPLVRALVQGGDEVVYFSSEMFAERIGQAGARYRPYRNRFLANPASLSEHTEQMSWILMRTVGEVLEQELDVFRDERPDYVISDSAAPWGQWVGQVLDVPVVTSVPTLAVNRQVLAFAARSGNRPRSARLLLSKIRHVTKAALLGRRLRRRHGVRGTGIMGLMFGSSGLNIVYTSRHFQPCAESFDERFVFIGPSIDAPTKVDAVSREPTPEHDLVYVSLGTLFNAEPAFYRACFEAFGGEGVRVLMSIGSNTDPTSLGTPPVNVEVKSWVPQIEVLRHAAVFVSHGGMNSVSESLRLGVPLVVVPQMGEQEVIARQVEALGAGLYVAKADATANRLRRAVNRVRGDARFRVQAALVRDSFDSAGGAERGAAAIREFTRGRGGGA